MSTLAFDHTSGYTGVERLNFNEQTKLVHELIYRSKTRQEWKLILNNFD